MQTNVLWTGRAYYSLENCLVNTKEDGTEITSVIVGSYENALYRVEYQIKTNPDWETVSFEIKCQHDNKITSYNFQSDGTGNWNNNGVPVANFKGCIDIDISLSPFTNTLPIKRLRLPLRKPEQIKVLYIDLLKKNIKAVQQKYTRLSDTTYQFENVPNDFDAVITIDELGLVVDYPELFIRTAKIKTEY